MYIENLREKLLGISEGKSILITGGTGSFGKEFVKYLINNSNFRRIIVFSRDEMKQYEFRHSLGNDSRLRWFIGDVRDLARFERAVSGVDIVVHAAALKQVDTAEENPFEFVKTNVLGSQNVIEACIDAGVAKVVGLSTDKASSPINLYGATKLTADKLFLSADIYTGSNSTTFSVVRYGNVFGSRGSVAPLFSKLKKSGEKLSVTDPNMTRFWLTLKQAIEFVVLALTEMKGGELFIPKIPSILIMDLVRAFEMGDNWHKVGVRPGEKIHEEMISEEESRRCFDLGDYYVLTNKQLELDGINKVPEGFSYSSGRNEHFLSVEDIQIQLVASGLF